MAHYNCDKCSGTKYPNCCAVAQRLYIERQMKQWAQDKAKKELYEAHKKEIEELSKKIILENNPYKDRDFIIKYLQKLGPIRK